MMIDDNRCQKKGLAEVKDKSLRDRDVRDSLLTVPDESFAVIINYILLITSMKA